MLTAEQASELPPTQGQLSAQADGQQHGHRVKGHLALGTRSVVLSEHALQWGAVDEVQGELEVANTTAQHLVRALTEGIDVVWVAGWGGGYNVLVARDQFNVPAGNPA